MSDTQPTIEDDVDLDDDILRDDDLDNGLDEADAEDAFFKNLTGADEATGDQEEGEGDDDPEAEGEDKAEGADAPADKTKDAKAPAGDDAIVEVKVGEETHQVPVKDLKRLFGQEAALTRKSQEVARQSEALRADAERTRAVVSKALERAQAKAKPYAEMDFLRAGLEMDAETFAQLRADAKEAFDEVAFFETEHAAAGEALSRAAQVSRQEAVAACVAALSDPKSPHYFEGWGAEAYGDILTFAEKQGFDAKEVTDPAAIKLIRMAMLYERGKTLVRDKVKKVAEQPKTPLRPGRAGGPTQAHRAADDAAARLRRTGRAEDAEAAFMSRLRPRDED